VVYYCDYEALEFDNDAAVEKGIYPYYLTPALTETSLCPIFFSACTANGKVVQRQNVFKQPISFLKFIDGQLWKYQKLEEEKRIIFCWFHNVKYDFRIIVHELFHNGFKNIVDSEKITYIGEVEREQYNAFSIVGQNLAKYIGINLYYRGFKILIRDTMSILNSAQDAILKDFGYPEKIDVPWQEITIDNLRENMQLIEERNVYDVTSLSKCIEEFKNTFSEHFHGKGSTAAGMSMDALKHYLCTVGGVTEINHETKNDFFRECYPQLEIQLHKDISKGCYHGGICTQNKKYSGRVLRNLQMIDINSSYPYSMTMPLPYGAGREISDFTQDGYTEYVVYVDFEMVGIPFQRCHSENRARDILELERKPKNETFTRSHFPEKFKGYLCINSIDLNTLTRYAKINKLEFKRGINYKTNTVIADFIIPIYEQRKISKGVMKLAIKLLLNSLYGKFAQDLSGEIFLYSDINEYERVIALDTDTIYKPFASAVTAYSRENLINTMYMIGDDFIYCDTDSIYFKNVKRCMPIFEAAGIIHDNNLGKWATEYTAITKGKFLSKKNYIIECTYYDKDAKREVTKVKLTCVGLSHKYHNQVNFSNFVLGSAPFEIYKMVNIYGGKAMRKTTFEIKERYLY